MTRSIFGWDLPPGCSQRDIEEAAGFGSVCEVCDQTDDECTCPECPVCGEVGRLDCYNEHGLQEYVDSLKKP